MAKESNLNSSSGYRESSCSSEYHRLMWGSFEARKYIQSIEKGKDEVGDIAVRSEYHSNRIWADRDDLFWPVSADGVVS